MTVDEFVNSRILPQHQPIAEAVRKLMRECVPDAAESIAYNMPVWKKKRILAYIIPNKQGITFSFTYGMAFTDRHNLLRGVGKVSRHVAISSVEDVSRHEAALRDYIQQAIDYDAT